MSRRIDCPRCNGGPLTPTQLEGVEVDRCAACQGIWFDDGELSRVVKQAVGSVHEGSPLAPPQPGEQIACPVCGVPLSTYAFSGDAFDIDLCRECGGIWLDRGELERVEQGRVREILERRAGVRGWLLQFLLQIPVEFNLPPQRFALITLLLLVANVLVMLAVIAAPAPNMLVELGALFPARVGSGQWVVSTITHQFLHAGLAHLALNMVFLWKLGDNVEDALGRAGYLLFYLVCGIAGGLVHTALDWGSPIPMVGASGAISGVMGAYAVLYRRARLTLMVIVLQFKLSAAWWMAIWAAMNVAGFLLGVDGIAWGAHLGGFAVGLVAGWALDRHVVATRPRVRLLRDAAAARPRTPPTAG